MREREREKGQEGRREKKRREGSLEKQTDTGFGGEDNGVTNLTEMGESKKRINLLQTRIPMVHLPVPFEIIFIQKNCVW